MFVQALAATMPIARKTSMRGTSGAAAAFKGGWRPPQLLVFLLLHPWSYALRIIGMRVSRILAADEAQVVIPVTAHEPTFAASAMVSA